MAISAMRVLSRHFWMIFFVWSLDVWVPYSHESREPHPRRAFNLFIPILMVPILVEVYIAMEV